MEGITAAQSDEARWQLWKAKGRADELRFRRRLKTVLFDVAAVLTVGAAIWYAVSF